MDAVAMLNPLLANRQATGVLTIKRLRIKTFHFEQLHMDVVSKIKFPTSIRLEVYSNFTEKFSASVEKRVSCMTDLEIDG
jgi:hypothetical protein